MIAKQFQVWILTLLFLSCNFSQAFGDTGNFEKWLDIPSEYKDEIADALETSKEFTEEQIQLITTCLEESSLKDSLNCLSDGGMDEAMGILLTVSEAFTGIKDRICGGTSLTDRDRCRQIQSKLNQWKDGLAGTLSGTIKRGQKYLEERNRLFFMKRQICAKIGEKGCWSWLDDRLNLKCDPGKIGSDPEILKECRLTVVNEVWERLGN
jgi:hypothetical protein